MQRPESEADRLAALRRYRIVDTAPEPVFDELVRTAARLLGTPIAVIALADETRQWCKASVGIDPSDAGRDVALCAQAIRADEVLVVPDALADPRFAGNALVSGAPGIRFCAAAPLITRDGHAIGALCVMDTVPRMPHAQQACDTLAALSRVVIAELESRLAALETAELVERLERLNVAAVALSQYSDLDELLGIAAEQARAISGATISLAIAEREGSALAFAAAKAGQGGSADFSGDPAIAQLVASYAARRDGIAQLTADGLRELAGASGAAGHPWDAIEDWMTVPLCDCADHHIGVLILGGAEAFAPSAGILLAQLARLVSAALRGRLLVERAQSAETRFRVLFERNPSPMWVFDRESLRFLEVNDAAVELYGWSRDEFMRMTVLDLRAKQDVPRLLAVLDDMNEGLRHHGEWQHINRQGEVVHVLLSAYYGLEHDGRAAGLTVIHDITARKRIEQSLAESETRFRYMADSVPALLWVAAPDNETEFVNRQWLEYSGRRLEDEIRDGWEDLLHPDDRKRAIEVIYGADEKRVSYETEYRLRRHDGVYRWFLDSGSPRFSPDGSYLGYAGILLDITERRQLEAELRQFQKMEAIGRLTGGIAHDFNNLLCVIMGNSEMMAAETEGNAYLNRLATMTRTAADRGAGLVSRLLAFSRTQTLQPVVTSIDDLIVEMHGLLRRTLGEDVDIVLDIHGDLWRACVDPEQLETALLNLAINARDAMAGGGRLIITTGNLRIDDPRDADGAPAGDYVSIIVADNGSGMSEEAASRAFEPFFTTKEVGKGTGLGLSMIYGFAQQSRGHVSLHSELGVGTTVRILLPREIALPLGDAAARTGPDRTPERRDAGTTILLVEDEELLREMLASQLAQLGYEVLTADDGPSGLAQLQQHPQIDLLLTDMVMPNGMSGRQLAEAAWSFHPDLPVLFMSGYTEDRIPVGSGDRVPFVRKPFTKQVLADAIRSALEAPSRAEPGRINADPALPPRSGSAA